MAAPLTKDNPARVRRDLAMVEDRLAGKSYEKIAKLHDISRQRAYQVLTEPENIDILETGKKAFIFLVPKAVDNYEELLCSETEKIKLEASRDVLKTTRIMDAHTREGDNYYFNIMNKHTNVLITEDMQDFMKWKKDRGARVYDIPCIDSDNGELP